jgi:hypothetical protein
MKGYCPHFREEMDLDDCYFCFWKNKEIKNP